MSDLAPQAMLFGIAIDLALLGLVYLRLSRDYYFLHLLALVLVLGLGAVSGFAKASINSTKALVLLFAYELMLPFVIWTQLSRFLRSGHMIWVPLPFVIAFGAVAQVEGWGFQSEQMLLYGLVFLVVQFVLVMAWSLRRAFAENEMTFLLAALAVLLVLGPSYGLIWTDLGVHFDIMAIAGGVAGALIIAGWLRNSFLHFTVPRSVVGGGGAGPDRDLDRVHAIAPGLFMVRPEGMTRVRKGFDRDLRGGRYGLFISMGPVAKVLGDRDGREVPTLLAAQLTHSGFIEKGMDPSDTGTIRRSLAEFLKRTGDGMVFIKDLHYLVSNTDVWEVGEVLAFLKDRAPSGTTTVLVGTDLLDEREVEHLASLGFREWEVALGKKGTVKR